MYYPGSVRALHRQCSAQLPLDLYHAYVAYCKTTMDQNPQFLYLCVRAPRLRPAGDGRWENVEWVTGGFTLLENPLPCKLRTMLFVLTALLRASCSTHRYAGRPWHP